MFRISIIHNYITKLVTKFTQMIVAIQADILTYTLLLDPIKP